MDDNVIIIEINGQTYYISSDRLADLGYIDNKLVNVSNSNITLVHSFDTVTTYPRITCASMSQCVYRSSQQSTQVGVTSNYIYNGDFNIKTLQASGIQSYILWILIAILGVKLLWKQ